MFEFRVFPFLRLVAISKLMNTFCPIYVYDVIYNVYIIPTHWHNG